MQPVNISNLELMISQFCATCIFNLYTYITSFLKVPSIYPSGVRICENNTWILKGERIIEKNTMVKLNTRMLFLCTEKMCLHTIRTWLQLLIDSYACNSGIRFPLSSCWIGLLIFFLFPFFFFFWSFSPQVFFRFDPPFCLSFVFKPATFAHYSGKLNGAWALGCSTSI